MPSDLFVSVLAGSAVFQAGAFQYGILAEPFTDIEHCLLDLFVLFQILFFFLMSVFCRFCKQVELFDDDPVPDIFFFLFIS